MTYATPSAAVEAGGCPMCLGDGVTFHVVEDRMGPCSGCGGSGLLSDMTARQCVDPACPDHPPTMAARVVDRNDMHVRVSVWCGKVPGHRQLVGTLVFGAPEWDALHRDDGSLMIPMEVANGQET